MATILYFGRLADVAGGSEAKVELPPHVTDTGALRDWLGRDDPALGLELRHPSVRIAVNQEVAVGDIAIGSGDEIAFLAPMSGG
ncbi:MAG: MoaD/ThiS family protein [Pseudomonadota bacterium]|nr:MoaD/ThiS family protein [Pseudomonadota bacterium]